MMLKNKIICCALLLAALVTAGCGVTIKYSLSGASIPPDAKTFSVAYFPNNAPMVEPILSTTLTDALIDKFTRQTRLSTREATSRSRAKSRVTPRRRRRWPATTTRC